MPPGEEDPSDYPKVHHPRIAAVVDELLEEMPAGENRDYYQGYVRTAANQQFRAKVSRDNQQTPSEESLALYAEIAALRAYIDAMMERPPSAATPSRVS